MRTAFDVGHPVFLDLRLEPGRAAPVDVLTPLIGEHLLGNSVFGDRPSVDFDDTLGRLAAIQPQPGDIPGVIVQIPDQVRRPDGT